MANNRVTYQQQTNVSIPRKGILSIACDDKLKKVDYKVILCLFSTLDGWKYSSRTPDPENFKAIDISQIADNAGVSKKDVKESINKLIDRGYIQDGCNDTISKGYRFTF